jgi:hypothetical protein
VQVYSRIFTIEGRIYEGSLKGKGNIPLSLSTPLVVLYARESDTNTRATQPRRFPPSTNFSFSREDPFHPSHHHHHHRNHQPRPPPHEAKRNPHRHTARSPMRNIQIRMSTGPLFRSRTSRPSGVHAHVSRMPTSFRFATCALARAMLCQCQCHATLHGTLNLRDDEFPNIDQLWNLGRGPSWAPKFRADRGSFK